MAVTLTVGTNSYLSVADANGYLSAALYAESWENATPDDQAKALIGATRAIDRQIIKGRKKDADQLLAFPRCYTPTVMQAIILYHSPNVPAIAQVYDGPLDQDKTFIPALATFVCEAAVPQAVLDATCEEALARLAIGNSERRKMQLEGVTSYRLGALAEQYATGKTGRSAIPKGLMSQEARELMRPYLGGVVQIR